MSSCGSGYTSGSSSGYGSSGGYGRRLHDGYGSSGGSSGYTPPSSSGYSAPSPPSYGAMKKAQVCVVGGVERAWQGVRGGVGGCPSPCAGRRAKQGC